MERSWTIVNIYIRTDIVFLYNDNDRANKNYTRPVWFEYLGQKFTGRKSEFIHLL